ncbi:hypothetical protein HYH03_013243 [Edaphochlamys debaryana]|uniref:Chitinase n=1 Tax=Edaphochlamys debaryana TaxID=47281 RepID=A0A835XQ90_9CHLO|nr:hypothetical protein HYH03_013243 [Edaphochlamys debaryana]|eukprot:KAG2488253.1 hypothetical protein HYH03_013243 [Edaphochlamys debaryana]
MAPGRLLALAAMASLLGIAAAAVNGSAVDSVVGVYLPGYAHFSADFDNFNMSAINLTGVSHAYYAFIQPNPDGTVFDAYPWNGGLSVFMALKPRWPKTNFILSVGGGGFSNANWKAAVSDANLNTFVTNLVNLVKTVNADGIDLDWETPDSYDRNAYTALCAALRSRLDALGAAASPPRKMWLTAATGGFPQPENWVGFNLPVVKTYLDLFNIMTYELHDPCYWETTTNFHTAWSGCKAALDFYIGQGVPRNQLVLGLAFYGHGYTLLNKTNYMHPAPSVELRVCGSQIVMSYSAIMKRLRDQGGGVFVNAPERSAYYVKDTLWVGFDTEESLYMKQQGAHDYGIAGVMIWDGAQDAPGGRLLRSVAARAQPTVRPCGKGYIGTGACANTSECCSEFGYCGVTAALCGFRCRSGPCRPLDPPSPPRPPSPPSPPPVNGSAPDSVTGVYIPGYAHLDDSGFNISKMNLTGVSHAYYAFIQPNTEGTVFDAYPWNGGLTVFMALKPRWPKTNFILSVGGGGFSNANWKAAVSDANLNTFVTNLVNLVKTVNADGIDLDWEMPDVDDRNAYTALCAALRSRLDALGAAASPPRKMWLTAATGAFMQPENWLGYNVPVIKNYLDLFNIMTYDLHDPCYWESTTNFHTSWSNIITAVASYSTMGIPRSKQVLGLAFYGHAYTLTDKSSYMHPAPSIELRDCSNMDTRSYRDIVGMQAAEGGSIFFNAPERAAYYVKDYLWIGFDTAETLAMKIEGSRNLSMAGVMIWDGSQDMLDGRLLRSVAARTTPPVRACGGGWIGNGRCANSAQCCSEFGYCGTNETFCGYRCRSGPCVQYPSPPPRPPQPPPSCGDGVVGSGNCADATLCCSSAGYCWDDEDHCGVNCVGGPCWYKPRPPPPPPSPPPAPAPPPLPYGCGRGLQGNGSCPNPDDCCSAFGYCANDDAHCGYGCVGGPCQVFPPPPPGVTGPMCGGGTVGNGQCGFAGQCCSQHGWPKPPPSPPRPPAPKPSPPRPPAPPPLNTTPCGDGVVGNGKCADANVCCSRAGWCWNDYDHCRWEACLSGPCYKRPPLPPGPPPSPPGFKARPGRDLLCCWCGDGQVGSGRCPDATQCCSRAGWCYNDAAHCNADACVGGPCWTPPPAPAPKP